MGPKRILVKNQGNVAKKPKLSGHWSLGLLDAMKDPECVVKEDDTVVVIKDKYPKAEFHYLIAPKEDISSLKKVDKTHIDLLEHMQELAETIVNDNQHKDKSFRMGYHAEASMVRLHLHVISNDMNSNALKTKKHWNSFTTDFFLDSKEVCKQLKEEGTVTLPSAETCKKLLDTPLKCHKCEYIPKHMPDLKKHIMTHVQ
ncbi:hypothetical protein RN001_014421 [Aquatica leii]|uniref:HIT domain-containing protein n=1 Tax=Aquatica leii TaxID=1421715 RepID=A0AAN7PPC5_9COLE|nr:hypothetical protein RN001_014421 [Aquatica leii]